MFHYQHWPSAALTLLAFTLSFGLFLLPGFAVAVLLDERRKMARVYLIVTVIAAAATLGYGSFWLFWISRAAGKVFTFFVYGLALFFAARSFLKSGQGRPVLRQIAAPFVLVLLAGVCYVSLFNLFGDPAHADADLANARFFEEGRPGDNLIPLLLAERIYNHEPLRPFCCGDWLSSDRPPLQSGIFLLQQPFRILSVGAQYELLATALQCLWICGAWCLLTVLGAAEQRIRQVTVMLICSGFFFYNSVYTWPKLLAAACLLLALSVLLQVVRSGRSATRFETVLAAVCVSLALMAHPGSIFSLPAFAIVFLRYGRLFPVRVCLPGLLVVLIYTLPWSAYQKFVDPPGNRLLKMHLAGQYEIDPRSTWQAIADAYRSRPLGEVLGFKWSNLRELVGYQPQEVFDPRRLVRRDSATASRTAQREWIWNAVGLLNLGWLPGIGLLISKKKRRAAVPYSRWLIIAALVNLTVWAMIMLGPRATPTTHSSYVDIILLSVGLCRFLFMLPASVVFFVFLLQIWNLLVVWAWFPPVAAFTKDPKVETPFLFFAAVSLAILGFLFTQACFQPPFWRSRKISAP